MANWPQDVPPAPDVQVAVFSAYLGRLLSAPGFGNLSIPAGWPVARALEVNDDKIEELSELVGSGGVVLFSN